MDRRRTMSQQHKDAIRRSRRDNRVVGAYLEALRTSRRRGRRRTLERVDDELPQTAAALAGSPSPVEELHLVQRRRDLEAERQTMLDDVDVAGLEDAFVEIAGGFSERIGIRYASWREVGVAPALLKRAGISRSTATGGS